MHVTFHGHQSYAIAAQQMALMYWQLGIRGQTPKSENGWAEYISYTHISYPSDARGRFRGYNVDNLQSFGELQRKYSGIINVSAWNTFKIFPEYAWRRDKVIRDNTTIRWKDNLPEISGKKLRSELSFIKQWEENLSLCAKNSWKNANFKSLTIKGNPGEEKVDVLTRK